MNESFVDFGVSTGFFVSPKPPGNAIIVGGQAGVRQWTRVLPRRVAHNLWYHLTLLLYPERSARITTRAATAVIREEDAPKITTHIEVYRGEGDLIEIMGTGGQREWLTRAYEPDARALWAALDKMLFPLGWEGSRHQAGRRPDN